MIIECAKKEIIDFVITNNEVAKHLNSQSIVSESSGIDLALWLMMISIVFLSFLIIYILIIAFNKKKPSRKKPRPKLYYQSQDKGL